LKHPNKKTSYSLWDKVKVYKEPSDESEVIDVIHYEEVFYILKNSTMNDDPEWIQVENRAMYIGFINSHVSYKIIEKYTDHEETFIISKVLLFFFIMGSAVIYSNTSDKLTFYERINESLGSEIYFILGLVLFYFLYKERVKTVRKKRLKELAKIKEKYRQ
jgi:hypothetical protein